MTPKNNKYYFPNLRHRAWLYDFVFVGRSSLLIVLLLLGSFLVQPVHKSFAQTSVEQPTAGDVAPQESSEAPATEITDELPDVLATENDIVSDEAAATAEEDTLDLGSVTENTTASNPDVNTVGTSSATSTEEINTPAETNDINSDEPVELPELSDSEEDELNDVLDGIEDELLNTPDTVTEVEYVVTDENYYQFSRQACVAMGDGSYHCTIANDSPEQNLETVVYADEDERGIKQIFLRTSKGAIKQITDGDYDNSSPHYSPESMQLVWQRMIEGRYQIIVYDIETGKEQQLTFSRTNNMEPKVSKDGIVWQAWDGNDWEIMFFDGTYTDQLTNNEIPDVAPVIEETYILWSVPGKKEQEARVYSLESKETLTIENHEGGSIVNPRFVLVYDTRFENGDVITQGFDPETGLSEPLGAEPGPKPVEIPDVDPLGEVRALVNGKSQHEDDLNSVLQPDQASSSDSVATVSASTTDTLNLAFDTPSLEASLDLGATTTPDINFELTDYDLVIVPVETISDLGDTTELNLSASSTQQ